MGQVRGREMKANLMNSTAAIFRMASDPRIWGPHTGEIPHTRSLGWTSRIPKGGDSVRRGRHFKIFTSLGHS